MGQPGAGRAGLNELARRWSALHHGIDPARVPLLRDWLRVVWLLARPLARRRVPPTVITVCGVLLAGCAVSSAASWPGLAAVLVLAAAGCDGLDGAVAVVGDCATRAGAVADATADRLADAAFAAVLWRCGAPWTLAVLAGVLAVAVDAVRRLRRSPAVITVAERPSWTVCTVLACVSRAVSDASWPVLVCALVWIALGVAGQAQLALPSGVARPRRGRWPTTEGERVQRGRFLHRNRPADRSRNE